MFKKLLFAASILLFAIPALATEKIELVMPWAAGGSSDLYARRLAEIISKDNAEFRVDVVNKVGANGKIAYNYFAQQKRALIVEVAGIITQANSEDYPKDLLQMITALHFSADPPRLLYTSLPVENFDALRELSKTREVLFGASNPGTSSYAVYDWLCNIAKLLEQCKVIFYRGTGHAMPDVLSGRIHLYTAAYNTVVHSGFTSAGKAREVLVLDYKPLTAIPRVTNLSNLNMDKVKYDIIDWHGLFHIGLTNNQVAIIKQRLQNLQKEEWFQKEGYGRLDTITPEDFFNAQKDKHKIQ